jgi:hypothetical protein
MTKRYENALAIISDKGWDFRKAIVEDGRNWLADCFEENQLGILGDGDVLAGIERHYSGGLIAFLRDGTYI